MLNDEIVDEVRAIRDTHAARFGYDPRAIYEDLKKSEAEHIAAGHPICFSTVCTPSAQLFIAADSLRSTAEFGSAFNVYLTSSDPLRFDPMTIREDLAARYVDQDCSFDLRILMVRGSEVAEAYLLPWALFAVEGAEWKQRIDLQQYRTVIPSDIQPEHLRSGAG
jgi:hypothetical protein